MEETDVDVQEPKHFDRGSSLSIFASDRLEDFYALGAALIIALATLLFVAV